MDNNLAWLSRKLRAAGKAKSSRDEYANLKTDEQRFLYTLRLSQQYEVQPKLKIVKKNSSQSEIHRKRANEIFVSKNSDDRRDEILELYNKSIAFAENDSRELSCAYGNRSALLFRARLYDHSIRDVDRALKIGCPENVKIQHLIRRAHCLMARDEFDDTNDVEERSKKIERAISEAEHLIEKTVTDEGMKKKFLDNLKNPKKIISKGSRKMFDEEKHKPPTPVDNAELPGVSGALKVSYDEKFGRHVTATRKIYPGEILCVQQGYATILAPDHFHTHCSNCLRQTWSAVPCQNCVEVIYCGEDCRAEAWKDHHDVECGVVGPMLDLEFNLLGLMSLRLAIRAVRDAGGFEELRKKIDSVESSSDPRTKGFTGTPPTLRETDYASVYTLAKNTEKRSVPDMFGRSFNSVFIVCCVATLTDFLGEKLPLDLRAVENNPRSIFLGGLLTTHQQIISSNVHTVTETKGLDDDSERGASIIPFLSYFNHSCHCMVVRVHYGKHVVARALETIEAGQQVYDNYGMHSAIEPRSNRRMRLWRQFYFGCECRPCSENWPLYEYIPSYMKQKLDSGRRSKLQIALKKLPEYIRIATDCEIEDKLYIVEETELMLKTLYENVDLPCQEVNAVVETLKRMYALLSIRYQSICDTKK